MRIFQSYYKIYTKILDIQNKSLNDSTPAELYKIAEEGGNFGSYIITPKMALRELWHRAEQSQKEKSQRAAIKISKLLQELEKGD